MPTQIPELSIAVKRRLTATFLHEKEKGKYSVSQFIVDTPELAGHKQKTVVGWLRQFRTRLEDQDQQTGAEEPHAYKLVSMDTSHPNESTHDDSEPDEPRRTVTQRERRAKRKQDPALHQLDKTAWRIEKRLKRDVNRTHTESESESTSIHYDSYSERDSGGSDSESDDITPSRGDLDGVKWIRQYALATDGTPFNRNTLQYRAMLWRRGYARRVWGWRNCTYGTPDATTVRELEDMREYSLWNRDRPNHDPLPRQLQWRNCPTEQENKLRSLHWTYTLPHKNPDPMHTWRGSTGVFREREAMLHEDRRARCRTVLYDKFTYPLEGRPNNLIQQSTYLKYWRKDPNSLYWVEKRAVREAKLQLEEERAIAATTIKAALRACSRVKRYKRLQMYLDRSRRGLPNKQMGRKTKSVRLAKLPHFASNY